MERQSGVAVDCLITGRYPGSGKPGPFAFPDPAEACQEIDKILVLTLPQLIQLKLAARRHSDFGDVVFLIQTHNLDESFLQQLHPSVHADFIECLEEKRREDEYQARGVVSPECDGLPLRAKRLQYGQGSLEWSWEKPLIIEARFAGG